MLILPFLGGEEVYAKYDFNEPWNGSNNSRLQAELPEWFAKRFHCLETLSGERGAIHPRGIQYVDTAQSTHAFPKADRTAKRCQEPL